MTKINDLSDCEIIVADSNDEGERIDRVLISHLPQFTRSSIQNQILAGDILVNEKITSKNYKLKLGDKITVLLKEPVELNITEQDIPLDIVYEDNDLLVVNKPKGMVVHPAAGHYENTLVNALLFHCKGSLSGINGVIRPGIVHRIDKDTSGLLLVAKNDNAHNSLAAQIKEHTLLREYQGVVYGNVKEENGVINLPIGRSKQDRKKMCVTDINSKEAYTYFEVIERYEGFTHMRFKLKTGRTHQIRVHMAHLGHALAGDEVYGPKKVIKKLNGQCLHAKTIGFNHPVTNEWLEFDSNLPEYFTDFLKGLKKR